MEVYSYKAMNDQGFIKFAGAIAATLTKSKAKDAILCIEDVTVTDRNNDWKSTQAARLIGEATYQFTKFKSKKPAKQALKKVTMQLAARKGSEAIKNALAKGAAIAIGVNGTPLDALPTHASMVEQRHGSFWLTNATSSGEFKYIAGEGRN